MAEMSSFEEVLSDLELGKVSGGVLVGLHCAQCGNLGLEMIEDKKVGPGCWNFVYQCPNCGGYTFKSVPPKDGE